MKIKLDGEWVCSLCGEIWENGYGPINNRNPSPRCAGCGAGLHDEFTFDGPCVEDDYSEESTPEVEGVDLVGCDPE